MRYVRTNKSETDDELIAKSRIVTHGDVDPDGEITVEDGGFRRMHQHALKRHFIFSYLTLSDVNGNLVHLIVKQLSSLEKDMIETFSVILQKKAFLV